MASILMIEDQAFHREVLTDILMEIGHQVTAVSTGNEAMKVTSDNSFDLILTDIFLEGENGLEVCLKLSSSRPDVPIIIMTASPSLELAIQSIRQGAYDFLVKPLNKEMVIIAVQRALERKRLIDEKNFLIQQLMDSNRVLKSFQKITLATVSMQRPKTILGKAVRGIIDVTGSSGGAVLLKAENLKLPFPYVLKGDDGGPGPAGKDFEMIYGAFAKGTRQIFMPPAKNGKSLPSIRFKGPLIAESFDLEDGIYGGVVLWKDAGLAPFQPADHSVLSAILRTMGYLLNARLRQRVLQNVNRRLNRRIMNSSAQMKKIRSKLENLVFEVEKEKTKSSEAIQRLEILNRIGQEMGSFVDIERHIQKVMKLCMEALQAKIISLMLLDRDADRLYIKYAIGLPGKIIETTSVKPGEGISGWVFQKNKPLFIGNVETDRRFHKTSHEQYETSSLISTPVCSNEKVIGVLNVNNKIDGSPFTSQDLDLLVFVSHEVGIAIDNTNLYEDIQKSYFETIRALIRVLEAKDETTKGHSERVTNYCLAIGKMMGLSHQAMEILKRAGILHDLGKVAVDLSILRKEGKLTEEEYNIIQKHPLVAAEIIRPMQYMEEVQKCIKQHHERQDGHGYPHGIKEICLEAKILAVADSYDAMTSWRPYRAPLKKEEALRELKQCSGTQFDPEVVKAFVKLIRMNSTDIILSGDNF